MFQERSCFIDFLTINIVRKITTLRENKEVKEEDVKRVIYHQGKRMIKKKINKKKVVGVILVIALIAFLIVYIFTDKKETDEQNIVETSSQVTNNTESTNLVPQQEEEKKYENVDIPEKLGGYDVLGQLVIEKIGVRQNVLSKTESGSLKLGVTKFYPPQVNINEPR